MSRPIEISFAPKKKSEYIINSGTNYGNYSKEKFKSHLGELETNDEPLYTAPLLLKLFILSSSLNVNPFDKKTQPDIMTQEYLNQLPKDYFSSSLVPKDKKIISQTKTPLVYYKGEEKKVKFF